MSIESHAIKANFATVTKNLRRAIPVGCEGCKTPNKAAEELPKRAATLGIELQYLIEPSAEVFGECQDGKIELDYPECQARCSNPNLDVDSPVLLSEQMIVRILDKADWAQNHGKGDM